MYEGKESVPEELRGVLRRYVEHKIPPGGFLTACLENNLAQAFGRADHINVRNLENIVGYIWNEIPAGCWGSKDKVRGWLEQEDVSSDE